MNEKKKLSKKKIVGIILLILQGFALISIIMSLQYGATVEEVFLKGDIGYSIIYNVVFFLPAVIGIILLITKDKIKSKHNDEDDEDNTENNDENN